MISGCSESKAGEYYSASSWDFGEGSSGAEEHSGGFKDEESFPLQIYWAAHVSLPLEMILFHFKPSL